MLTGAQVMVKCLEAEGIKAVFGYPGVAICPFYDSLYDSGIRNILVRQEQNGGHMASGYARVTRKPAVCVATSGPGATNLLSCYVHDLRLQCLEYFGKFYQDGGKPFEPLAINTKYVDIQS